MYVEIKDGAKKMCFEEFSGGDIFVYDNEAFIVLTDEIFDSGPRSTYNAVNLETGEPVHFTSKQRVTCPNDHTLTVEL